jgi:predicted metal-binding protein
MTGNRNPKLQALIAFALKSGATGAVVVSTQAIVVDEALARRCLEPRCENYWLSKGCPPHVAGPRAFENLLKKYSQALFFKIDLPKEILYSSDNREIFQLLHEMAADLEKQAIKTGFPEARAYAGGSCKTIFCRDHLACQALSENGKCRNPDAARPSMSGFGIHVAKLFEAAGWSMNWTARNQDSLPIPMANVSGLVLIC